MSMDELFGARASRGNFRGELRGGVTKSSPYEIRRAPGTVAHIRAVAYRKITLQRLFTTSPPSHLY